MKFVHFEPVVSRRRISGQAIWFLFWLGVTLFGLMLKASPDGHGTHTQLGLPPCPSVLAFNRPCPGCGLTTSFTATMHGDFAFAFKAHPFGTLLYVLFSLSALACGYGFLKGLKFNTESKKFNLWLGVVVGLFLAFGIARFALSPGYGNGDPYHPITSK
ncbi:MAG: DUF2752 domain-containing protein [Fimbriimonadaceae bacterium]